MSGSVRTEAPTPAHATLARSLTKPRNGSTQLARRPDEESRIWLERLRSDGPQRELAIAQLHELLTRAASFEVGRRRGMFPQLRGGDLDDLAQQSADDALVAVLSKLDDFRGDSRFTTWAYKFALYQAAATVRRRAWQGREVPLTPEAWPRTASRRASPDQAAETAELLVELRREIDATLSPHQREVLIALALNEVPIDVLAERLNTTRGALYKSLHDARLKLRRGLAARGLTTTGDGETQ